MIHITDIIVGLWGSKSLYTTNPYPARLFKTRFKNFVKKLKRFLTSKDSKYIIILDKISEAITNETRAFKALSYLDNNHLELLEDCERKTRHTERLWKLYEKING